MAHLVFTGNLQRHAAAPGAEIDGSTVGDVLAGYFERHPTVRGYLLDDQGALRKHILVLIDGEALRDRVALSDALGPGSRVYVFQALSGG